MRPRRLVGILGGLTAAVAVARRLDVVEVRGRSMVPTLLPGDRLVVARARPRAGDVVLTADPRAPTREIVKRVAWADDHGVHLRGDNPVASTDGRAFGAVAHRDVAWRVLLRIWPLRRVGRIASRPGPIDEGGEAACTFPEALIAGGDHLRPGE